jgi:23S rRNA (pseudouridine1915-N3)-methyltransferase
VRLTILAVGRLKAGPDRALYERYAERIAAAGRAASLTLALREFGDSRAGSAGARTTEESAALTEAVPEGARLVVLDAAGKALTSEAFADRLSRWRDEGVRDVALVIGGADGLARPLVGRADLVLAFGAMTWPHQLVRIMLAEQIYRVVTILAGHPYHRGGPD